MDIHCRGGILRIPHHFHEYLLSADLTALEPDKWIDSLRDLLYDRTFALFTPTIFSQLSMREVLSKSLTLNGTDERVLYERIMADENDTIKTFAMGDSASLLELSSSLFNDMVLHKRAIIEDSLWMDASVEHLFCHMYPEGAENMVKSSGNLFGAPMSMLLSHETRPEIVRLFVYRSRTGVEFGMVKGVNQAKIPGAIELMSGVAKTIKGYQCTDPGHRSHSEGTRR